MPGYNNYSNKRGGYASRYSSARCPMASGRPYARPRYNQRSAARPASFGVAVKKANLASAPSKNVSACFMNHALHHNKWYKGKVTSGEGDAAQTEYIFQNMFAKITHGTEDSQRVTFSPPRNTVSSLPPPLSPPSP